MTAEDVDWAMGLAAGMAEAPHWTEAAYRAALDTEATPRRVALVAESAAGDCDLAERRGFLVASVVAPQAELEFIAVDARTRRAGIGWRLVAAMAERLRAGGVTEVIGEVRASNTAAIAFYERLGFEATGRRAGYYIEPVEDAVLMLWRIA